MAWDIYLTTEVEQWLDHLLVHDKGTHALVVAAVELLALSGPGLGRPLVDRVHSSVIHNLKESRPGSTGGSEVRILFVFDPWRSAILLVAGDEAGRWTQWYREAIPQAEHLYALYLKERAEEEGQP